VLPQLELLTYGAASAIAVTSSDVGVDLVQHLGRRVRGKLVEVVPNPIDADEIRHLSRLRKPGNALLRFCAVGRLAPEKGYDTLLTAAAAAAPMLCRPWELVIVGDGPLRNVLEDQVTTLGLQKHVKFAGFVDNPYGIMGSSQILVHAARSEGFGLVLGEALCLGLPIIATTCPGGPRAILDDGAYGTLVQPDRPAELAAAMVKMAHDDELRARLSRRGPERVRAFAPEAVAERFLQLAERLQI
jgi:glycosyltransferase involved in cell wall biosynthesis